MLDLQPAIDDLDWLPPNPGLGRGRRLVAIYTVNFLDRQIVTILIPDIKRDLNLSDSEVGAMPTTPIPLWFGREF